MSAIIVTAHLIAALNQHPTLPSWTLEEEAPVEQQPTLGPVRTGRATRYGVSYHGQRMGCGGVYSTYDPSIIAVGPSRYREWPCGTPLLVTGPYGSLIGTRRDSCPGCDAHGVIVDMSEQGHRIVCGPGTCTVTVQQIYDTGGGGRGWRELAL